MSCPHAPEMCEVRWLGGGVGGLQSLLNRSMTTEPGGPDPTRPTERYSSSSLQVLTNTYVTCVGAFICTQGEPGTVPLRLLLALHCSSNESVIESNPFRRTALQVCRIQNAH